MEREREGGRRRALDKVPSTQETQCHHLTLCDLLSSLSGSFSSCPTILACSRSPLSGTKVLCPGQGGALADSVSLCDHCSQMHLVVMRAQGSRGHLMAGYRRDILLSGGDV